MARAHIAAFALIGLLMTAGGCLRQTTFSCDTDVECSDGFCEPSGYCSFADSSCGSGRRYGALSGELSDACVGTENPDAPIGSPDASRIDGTVSTCPATYAALAGAPNVYRAVSPAVRWVDQQIACVADGAYLAIPDDANELAAITTLGGIGIWIGISDTTTEATFVTVQGNPATFLPWEAGQPDDDPPGEDCVMAASATTLSDERCNLQKLAVCECEP